MNTPLFATFVFWSSIPIYDQEVAVGSNLNEPIGHESKIVDNNHQRSAVRCEIPVCMIIEPARLSEEEIPRLKKWANAHNSKKRSKLFSYPHDTLDPGQP